MELKDIKELIKIIKDENLEDLKISIEGEKLHLTNSAGNTKTNVGEKVVRIHRFLRAAAFPATLGANAAHSQNFGVGAHADRRDAVLSVLLGDAGLPSPDHQQLFWFAVPRSAGSVDP